MSFQPLAQPDGTSVGDRLIAELTSGRWDEFRCAVAFAKLSGVRYLDGPLRSFVGGGGVASISVGVDHDGTSFEAVSQLLGAVGTGGRVFIVKHLGSPSPTFHPKVFLFSAGAKRRQPTRALLISGSTNLTEGGLFTNYEFGSIWAPDLKDRDQAKSLRSVVATLDAWSDMSSGLCLPLDVAQLVDLHKRGWLLTEDRIAKNWISGGSSTSTRAARTSPPAGLKRQKQPQKTPYPKSMGPPAVALPEAKPRKRRKRPTTGANSKAPRHSALAIDISMAKKTEVFLAKSALDEDPAFFGHPFTGRTRPRRATSSPQPERSPRPVVDLLLIDAGGQQLHLYQQHEVKLWEYVKGKSANMDVRMIIPQELLRSLPPGCILVMRRRPVGPGLDYRLEFLTPGSPAWSEARAVATKPLPGSKRRYGWI
jgi:HKD family nuclease